MCGTLKYEKKAEMIGNIPWVSQRETVECIDEHGDTHKVPWLGFHRSEKPDPKNAVPVQICASVYTEAHRVGNERTPVEFQVPSDKAILGWVVRSPQFPTGRGLFIATRPATSSELSRCNHKRHPQIVSKKDHGAV